LSSRIVQLFHDFFLHPIFRSIKLFLTCQYNFVTKIVIYKQTHVLQGLTNFTRMSFFSRKRHFGVDSGVFWGYILTQARGKRQKQTNKRGKHENNPSQKHQRGKGRNEENRKRFRACWIQGQAGWIFPFYELPGSQGCDRNRELKGTGAKVRNAKT